MIWLALSILCSTLIFIAFRLFPRFGIDNLQAIVINYLVAYSVGSLSGNFELDVVSLPEKAWFSSVIILGFLFISLFQLMAIVSQKFGVAAVSVAVKMSLVIPVVFAIFYYGESAGALKITGILLALGAVYFATRKPSTTEGHPGMVLLPILLFIGSGFLDSFLKYNQQELVSVSEHSYFASLIFLMAAVIGLFWYLFSVITQRTSLPQWKNILGGVALGIPNYGSIFFLIKALDMPNLESSVIFPVNNVGIVALSVICAKILFNENLSRWNLLGVILAMLSIALMTFVNFY